MYNKQPSFDSGDLPPNPATSVKESQHFALLGNQADTPLPIVDPETGRRMSFTDKKWMERFEAEHPLQFHKMLREILPRIYEYTGLRLHELEDVGNLPDRAYRKLIQSTRARMLKDTRGFPFLANVKTLEESPEVFARECIRKTLQRQREKAAASPGAEFTQEDEDAVMEEMRNRMTLKFRDAEFRKYGPIADDYIQECLEMFLPHYDKKLGIANEVKAVSDPARLLIMIFNKKLKPRVRHEAKRKLLLMEMLANLEDYGASEKSSEESLDAMVRFMQDHMIDIAEDGEHGDIRECFLRSDHEMPKVAGKGADRKTLETRLQDTPPRRLLRYQRVSEIPMRRAKIRDAQDTERSIRFFMDLREKGAFSRLTKRLRKDWPIEDGRLEKSDGNGIRLIFEEKADLFDFVITMKDRLMKAVIDALNEHLARHPEDETARQRLENIDNSVEIYEIKDSLDGNGDFSGETEASSEELKVFKFKLHVKDARNREHFYEFQCFLPDGYAEYLYRDNVNWEEYNVKRFFGGVHTLLFPPAIYGDVDYADAKEKAVENARERVWRAGAKVAIRENGRHKNGAGKKKKSAPAKPE